MFFSHSTSAFDFFTSFFLFCRLLIFSSCSFPFIFFFSFLFLYALSFIFFSFIFSYHPSFLFFLSFVFILFFLSFFIVCFLPLPFLWLLDSVILTFSQPSAPYKTCLSHRSSKFIWDVKTSAIKLNEFRNIIQKKNRFAYKLSAKHTGINLGSEQSIPPTVI